MAIRVAVFDVNETLLDLTPMAHRFDQVCGDGCLAETWFAQLLRLAMTSAITGGYHDFSAFADAALQLVAAKQGLALSEEQRGAIVQQMQHLPPHEDVPDGLRRLKSHGVRMAALTNSAPGVANAQLSNAGLADFFEHIISVDEVQCYKPAPQPYLHAASRSSVAPEDMLMVAVHDWDLIGAMHAGCAGAFVARGGLEFHPLAPRPPDIVGDDFTQVVDRILSIYAGGQASQGYS